MTSNRFGPNSAAIIFDASGAFFASGLSRDEHTALFPRMEAARRKLIGGGAGDAPGRAASIVSMPEQVLVEYKAARRRSELGRVLAAAKRLREAVDRVVIVGSAADCAAARALFDACGHPYHNEQARGDRGGRPRIYCAGEEFDNDHLAGLLDFLPHERSVGTIRDRWGIIAVDSDRRAAAASRDGEITPAAAAFRVLLAALRKSCGDEPEQIDQLILPIVREQSPIARICESLGSAERFQISAEIAGAAAVFSAAGMVPASVMGMDIVRLLQGAAAMNERLRASPIGDNPPLDFAGIVELIRQRSGGTASRRFVASGRGSTAITEWCDALTRSDDSGSQISDSKSNTAFTLTPALSHQENGTCSALAINLIVESVRRDRIAVRSGDSEADSVSQRVSKTLPELSATAIDSAKAALAAAGCPSVDIWLPALDEFSLGQLFQMLIIARVLEAPIPQS
jgi:glucose-6-phosphate isomerase